MKFWEFCFFSSNRKEQILQKFQWLVNDKITISTKIFLSLKFRANTESNNKIENKDLYNKYIAISAKLSFKVEEEKKHQCHEVEVPDNECDAADESGLKSGRNSNQECTTMENECFDR